MGERTGSPGTMLRRAAPAALLALSLAARTGAAQTPNLAAYHALVIGNQAYRQLPQLATPVADARAVADLLRRDYGFANVRVLETGTPRNITGAVLSETR